MPRVDQSSIRRDANGNPHCKRCGDAITNEEMHALWTDPRHPEVFMGPYCEECVPYIKVCSHCHHDFSLFKKDDERDDQITYCGDGIWLCHECKDNAQVCTNCNKIVDELHTFKHHDKVCQKCINSETFDCVGCGEKHLNCDSIAKNATVLQLNKYSNVFPLLNSSYWSDEVGENVERMGAKVCTSCFESRKGEVPERELSECKRCKSIFAKRSKTNKRSGEYCDACYDGGYIFDCEWCGKIHTNNDKMRIQAPTKKDSYRGVEICRSCFDKKFWCIGCYSVHSKSSVKSHRVPGAFIRDDSITHCTSCQTNNMIVCPTCKSQVTKTTNYHGSRVCSICKPNLHWCSDCERFHLDEGRCRTDSTRILSYGYKPFLIPKNTTQDKIKGNMLYMGIENEMTYSTDSDMRSALKHLHDQYEATELYPKSDGSISGYGFEVVTHPMTLNAFHAMKLRPLFAYAPRKHSSCGMHIHLNKNFFESKLHVFKMVTNYNTWEELVRKVAGRSFTGYAGKWNKKISKTVKDNGNCGRHSVVNLSNQHTIEIRIFQGCHTAKLMSMRVEFCHAMAYFPLHSSLKDKEDAFVAYVLKNKKVYPHLTDFLKAKWI